MSYKSYKLRSVFCLSRTERKIVQIIKSFIKVSFFMCTEIHKSISFFINLIKNFHIAYNNGYNLNILLNKFRHLTLGNLKF